MSCRTNRNGPPTRISEGPLHDVSDYYPPLKVNTMDVTFIVINWSHAKKSMRKRGDFHDVGGTSNSPIVVGGN